jgi:D-inositol-3-phosphate glycosyltransferase
VRRSRPGTTTSVALVSEHASPLVCVGGVDAGGQNVHVAELASALTRAGLEVVVYTRRDAEDLPERVTTPAGYEVVHVPAGPAAPLPKDDLWPLMPAFAAGLSRHFDTDRPDVVHAHFWMSGWAGRRAAQAHGVPFLITFHALGVVKRRHLAAADPSPADRLAVEAELARRADAVIATCRDEVTELIALGADPGRVATVPCGVDLDVFTPGDGPDDLRSPTVGGPARLVSVGRLVPRKGFQTIIEALPLLPDTELSIAGGPPAPELDSDDEANRLRRVARDLGVADRVRLLGAVRRPQIPALLRAADVVVCAPWYEPFGIVPVEAMACGVPVVAAAVGGLLDTVVDGVTGRHVPPQDPAALAGAVLELRDPDRRRAAAAASLQRARQHYSWASVAERTAAVYRAQPAPATDLAGAVAG